MIIEKMKTRVKCFLFSMTIYYGFITIDLQISIVFVILHKEIDWFICFSKLFAWIYQTANKNYNSCTRIKFVFFVVCVREREEKRSWWRTNENDNVRKLNWSFYTNLILSRVPMSYIFTLAMRDGNGWLCIILYLL